MKLNIGDKVMVKARNTNDPWWDLVAPGEPDGMIEVTVMRDKWVHPRWNCDVVELQSDFVQQTVPVSAIKPIKKPFTLKDGKKYETADGVVFKVRSHLTIFDVSDDTDEHWHEDGTGYMRYPDLIRRHYTKPQPAHKLDLKKGDVVELVKWENGSMASIGRQYDASELRIPSMNVKGERALFKVVSRAP